MDVGVGLWAMRSTAANPGGVPAMYADLVRDARTVEALGFHSLWLAEHHFWYDGWTPAPLVAASAALAATTRLRVGSGIHLLPLHDADRVADQVLALHRLSGGRFEYGVGLGYRAAEYDGFGLSRRHRGRRMDAALDRLDERWRASEEDGPRVWVGGFAEAAVRRTGRRGLGALLPSTLSARQIREAVARLRAEADAAGRAVGPVAVMKYAWIAEDDAERSRAIAVHAAATLEYTGAWFPLRGRPGFASPDLLAAQVDRAVATAVLGTAGQVVEQLAELAEAGADLVVLHLMGDARGPRTDEVLRVLAERVLPGVGGMGA